MAGLHLNVSLGDWNNSGLGALSHSTPPKKISHISIPSRFGSKFAQYQSQILHLNAGGRSQREQ